MTKKITIGMVAHVDAGKTTLSEALLYETGTIRKLGRVDHGDAFLDSDNLEKQRGITIFDHQARLHYQDCEITLVDTPGHVDFVGQTEQALSVLDYAILVVSATDGIKGSTKALWDLLTKYHVPTIVFINKMDALGVDGTQILDQLQNELSAGCVAFTDFNGECKSFSDAEIELMAMQDDAMLDQYLANGMLSDTDIQTLIKQRYVIPCCFGAALKLAGIKSLLNVMQQWTVETEFSDEFAARVFKISHDERNERLTWVRVLGGTLKAKTELLPGQKANQLRNYNGDKFAIVNEVDAGDVCAIAGLTDTYPGQGLGTLKTDIESSFQPVLSYGIDLNGHDVREVLNALEILADEDPQLKVVWDEQLQAIQVQMMGDVQLEILQQLMQDRFQLTIDFNDGGILYQESILSPIEGVGHFEPLRHYAEAHLLLEPAPRGTGMAYASECSVDVLDKNWQHQILTSLANSQPKGVLIGAPLTDVKVTLVGGRSHVKHTEGGDFRQAASRALRQGLMMLRAKGQTVLLEPWYQFRLTINNQQVGRAMNDLQRMQAKIAAPLINANGTTTTLTGQAPVSELRAYTQTLRDYTHGQGQLDCQISGYQPCHNAQTVIEEFGYVPTADLENTPDSVFCAHGAGYPVKWDDVPNKMHCDYYLNRE